MARRHRPLSEIRATHAARLETALAAAVTAALADSDWRPVRAARLLGCTPLEVRRVIDRHPEISERVRAAGHRPGAPKKAADPAA